MFIEINDIIVNVDRIVKICYREFNSIYGRQEFIIYIYTDDENITTLRFDTKEEFESKWEWIRNTILK